MSMPLTKESVNRLFRDADAEKSFSITLRSADAEAFTLRSADAEAFVTGLNEKGAVAQVLSEGRGGHEGSVISAKMNKAAFLKVIAEQGTDEGKVDFTIIEKPQMVPLGRV